VGLHDIERRGGTRETLSVRNTVGLETPADQAHTIQQGLLLKFSQEKRVKPIHTHGYPAAATASASGNHGFLTLYLRRRVNLLESPPGRASLSM